MKEFLLRNKIFLIVTLSTLIIVGGGIFLMSKPGNSSPSQNQQVDQSLLVPQGTHKTSGFLNGDYLPASESAKVTLVEFGDYVCPACGNYEPYVKKILTDYPGKIIYVFRNYPLSYHTNAPIASYAVLAAGMQGKYWQMHEKIFTTQSSWKDEKDPTSIFDAYAKDLGLDIVKFNQDLNSQSVKDIVQNDTADGDRVGLTETPTFFVNGVKVTLTPDPSNLEDLVKSEVNR